MSDIKIGSEWINRCDGVEAIVMSIGNDRVDFSQVIDDQKYFYSHTMEDFKEYYEPKAKTDMVNNPPHYKDESGIECIEVTKNMQFCGGNCFKYLYRAGKKGSTVEDLKKAVWYADKAWENEEVVLITPMRLIEKIAVHREGNIKQAMLYVAEDFWDMAKQCIEAEIARLESE